MALKAGRVGVDPVIKTDSMTAEVGIDPKTGKLYHVPGSADPQVDERLDALEETVESLEGDVDDLEETVSAQSTAIANLDASVSRMGHLLVGDLTLSQIHELVQAGDASKYFSIGDQITVPWTDNATNTTYQVPLDVVQIGTATLSDSSVVPAMYLQWHYATPFGVEFDAKEAFHVVPSGGYTSGSTFTFNVPTAFGSSGTGDFQFTIGADLAEGTLMVFDTDIRSDGISGATVKCYANGSSTTAVDTFTVSSGSSGTSLGELKTSGDTQLNNIQCTAYGYNRWDYSGLRQWLNSSANPDAWWTSKHSYDMAPFELATKYGFMSGFESDFLNTLQPVKVDTALNTAKDDGSLVTTYDTFFVPALNQMNIEPMIAGEGDVLPYWKEVSGVSGQLARGGTYPQMRTYGIDNTNNAQGVRLRSAIRDDAYDMWCVYYSGFVGYYYSAASNYRCAPVCVMC